MEHGMTGITREYLDALDRDLDYIDSLGDWRTGDGCACEVLDIDPEEVSS